LSTRSPLPVEPPRGLSEWRSLAWRVLAAVLVHLRAWDSRRPSKPAHAPSVVAVKQVASPSPSPSLKGTVMAKGFIYVLGGFPDPPAAELVRTRRLDVSANGSAPGPIEFPVDQATVELPPYPERTHLEIRLRHVDDVGNVGDPSDPLVIDVTDTIPPTAPGATFAIAGVRQVDIPDQSPPGP
jgi:hypothetical protein